MTRMIVMIHMIITLIVSAHVIVITMIVARVVNAHDHYERGVID